MKYTKDEVIERIKEKGFEPLEFEVKKMHFLILKRMLFEII